MRFIITGGFFLLSGVILFSCIYISTSLFAINLSGWATPPGRFATALQQMEGGTVYILSIIVIIFGSLLLLWGCFEKALKFIFKKLTNTL